MWSVINWLSNAVFALWFRPLEGLPPALQVWITALPVTVFALLVFKYASSQAGITAAKDRIKAYLLELWLYKDDPAVLLRAQGQVVVSSLEYLGYSLVPLAIMIVPLALVIVQLESRFAFRALEPGESAIVTVTLATGPDAPVDASLTAPPGLVVETPALRVKKEPAQVLWRVGAQAAGAHQIRIRAGAAEVTRTVMAGPQTGALAPAVYRASDWRVLGYPAEPPLPPDSTVAVVDVAYPRNRGEFLGLSSASWILLGVSMLFGYVLRGLFGVTF